MPIGHVETCRSLNWIPFKYDCKDENYVIPDFTYHDQSQMSAHCRSNNPCLHSRISRPMNRSKFEYPTDFENLSSLRFCSCVKSYVAWFWVVVGRRMVFLLGASQTFCYKYD